MFSWRNKKNINTMYLPIPFSSNSRLILGFINFSFFFFNFSPSSPTVMTFTFLGLSGSSPSMPSFFLFFFFFSGSFSFFILILSPSSPILGRKESPESCYKKMHHGFDFDLEFYGPVNIDKVISGNLLTPFSGQASSTHLNSTLCTYFCQQLITALLASVEWGEYL